MIIPTSIKKFILKSQVNLKKANSQITLLKHEIRETHALLETYKGCKKGKRIAIKGQIMLLIEDIVKIAREAREETYKKKAKKSKRHRSLMPSKEELIETESEDELA